MAKDILKRLESWHVKTEPDAVRERLVRMRESMNRRYIEEQTRLMEMEVRVKQVLDNADITSITYPFYLDFAREVYARKRRLAGSSLRREVEVLFYKWVMRELKPEVLERVRDEALSVSEPGE
jgi:hypothetical protein|uniref:Uncharacterized protein n=1 Tax=candidate division WOR-3 bacterium TaxID=2052148 RepID=A0A7V3PSF5_UNCW3